MPLVIPNPKVPFGVHQRVAGGRRHREHCGDSGASNVCHSFHYHLRFTGPAIEDRRRPSFRSKPHAIRRFFQSFKNLTGDRGCTDPRSVKSSDTIFGDFRANGHEYPQVQHYIDILSAVIAGNPGVSAKKVGRTVLEQCVGHT